MKILQIKKRSGGSRTIYVPSKQERQELRELLATIKQPEAILRHAHGFMPGRSIVTNAAAHVGKKMTISIDLSSFFDSVTPAMVASRVSAAVIERCFPDGAARQGLPTSPALANLAAAAMDDAIVKRLKKLGIPGVVYTRYADDLSVSCDVDDQETAERIIAEVTQIVHRCGFRLNKKKTRVQRASGGRREICGLMVDDTIHISRRTRRIIRAARHNYVRAVKRCAGAKTIKRLEQRLSGLLEFAMLKPPQPAETARERKQLEDAARLAREFGLLEPIRVRKVIPDADLGDGVRITSDPALIYGMSAYTTGWTSCMSIIRESRYRGGVAFWQRLEGVSLAYVTTGEKMVLAGVRRPKMAARCLIFALRDGRRAYGEIYCGGGHGIEPKNEHARKLRDVLRSCGYIPVTEARGALVVGHVISLCQLPYFDHGWVEVVTLQPSRRKAYRLRF